VDLIDFSDSASDITRLIQNSVEFSDSYLDNFDAFKEEIDDLYPINEDDKIVIKIENLLDILWKIASNRSLYFNNFLKIVIQLFNNETLYQHILFILSRIINEEDESISSIIEDFVPLAINFNFCLNSKHFSGKINVREVDKILIKELRKLVPYVYRKIADFQEVMNK
jgi:hypothetical protein